MVDVAEFSEKVENIADAGASRFIEVFDHRFVFVCMYVCIFFPMMKLLANMSILSYISEILN